MIIKMFAVYDSKAECFLPPFFFNSTGLACRYFTAQANNESSQLCTYAADFTLFEIGNYNDKNALVETISHHNLGTALSYKADKGSSNSFEGALVPQPELKVN